MKDKLTIGKIFIIIALTLLVLVTLYPIIYVLSMSLSSAKHILLQDVTFFPKEITTASYKMLFKTSDIWVAYRNTILYTVAGTLLGLICTIMIAYSVSQKNFRYRRVVIWYVMVTMFFSGGVVPLYILINSLGMMNTPWAIILPGAVSAWNIVIARTYFATLPDSLMESARIDGANEFRILLSIVVPVAKPILAVLALYMIVAYWNTYFSALLYLDQRPDLLPLQNYLQRLLEQAASTSKSIGAGSTIAETSQAVEQLKYSAIVVAMFPIMMIYPFLQKYFIKGIMVGSIKE